MEEVKICNEAKEKLIDDISIFLVSDRIKRKVSSIIKMEVGSFDIFIREVKIIKDKLMNSTDLFVNLTKGELLEFTYPILVSLIDDSICRNKLIENLDKNGWNDKIAREFIRYNIVHTYELVAAWETIPSISDHIIKNVFDANRDLKLSLTLPEPEKSIKIKEYLGSSIRDLENENFADVGLLLLEQVEEVMDNDRTEIVLNLPYQTKIHEYIK